MLGVVRARLAAALVLAWLLASVLLWVVGVPQSGDSLTGADSAMTWLQSVVLVVAGVAALGVAWCTHRSGRPGTRVWCALGVAYAVLALDERFALHDRVRAGRLLPRGAREQLVTWVGPGEVLLLLVAAAGLAAPPVVWRALRQDRWARTALAVGVGLAVVTVVADSIDAELWAPGRERLEAGVEEVLELGSAVALLACVLLRLVAVLDELVDPGP